MSGKKKVKKGKSQAVDKVESRHKEVWSLARELISQGIKDEKEIAEKVHERMIGEERRFTPRHIRYELLRKKAPDDIKKALGLKEKKAEDVLTDKQIKEIDKLREELEKEEFVENQLKNLKSDLEEIDIDNLNIDKEAKEELKYLKGELELTSADESRGKSRKQRVVKERPIKEAVENLVEKEKIEKFPEPVRDKLRSVWEQIREPEEEPSQGKSKKEEHKVQISGAGAGGGGGGIELSSETVKIIIVALFIIIIIAAIASVL